MSLLLFFKTSVQNKEIIADPSVFTFSANDASLLYLREIAASSGSYTISGINSGFEFLRAIQASPGAFDFSGQQAFPLYGRMMQIDSGSFSVSGFDAYKIHDRNILSSPSSVSINAQDSYPIYNRVLSLNFVSFSVNGFDVSQINNRILRSDPTSISLDGSPATFAAPIRFIASPGSISVNAAVSELEFSGAVGGNFDFITMARRRDRR